MARNLDLGQSGPQWLVESETYAFGVNDWDALAESKVAFATHVPRNSEYFARLHALGIRAFPYVTFYQGFAYQTYMGVNLRGHPEWIEVDEKGGLKRSSFWELVDSKNMYITCPNVKEYQDAMVAWVEKLMQLGADGVFIDNLISRAPCYGPKFGKHQHLYDDQNHAFAMLLKRVRGVVKRYKPDGAVLGNTAWPPKLTKEYWKYLDAGMLESYICTWASKDRRHDWKTHWNAVGKELQPFINAGKQIQALSYVGHTPYGVKEDSFFCYATARLAGFVWSGGSLQKGNPASILYRIRLGKPLTEWLETKGVHYRVFAAGMVAVNPDKGKALSIALPPPVPTKLLWDISGCGVKHWAQSERNGYLVDEKIKRSGSRSIKCINKNPSEGSGSHQSVELNQTVPRPIVASGWSKAENVSGASDGNYSLYLDILYSDGKPLYGQIAPFTCGTHEWEHKSVTIHPEKPIKSLTFYALFRYHTGIVWFDDLSLKELLKGELGSELLKNSSFEDEGAQARLLDVSKTDGMLEVPAYSGRVYLFAAPTYSEVDKKGPKLTVVTKPTLGEVRFRVDNFDYWTYSGRWTTEYVLDLNFGKFYIFFDKPGKHLIEIVDIVPAPMKTPAGYGTSNRLGPFMDPAKPTKLATKNYRFHQWSGPVNTKDTRVELQVDEDMTLVAEFDMEELKK